MNVEAGRDPHDDVFELLPWWVNETLGPTEAAAVQAHVKLCPACQREVTAQRRVAGAVRRDRSNLDHAPQASFEKLWSRMQELERDVPRAGVDAAPAEGAVPVEIVKPTQRPRVNFDRWRLAAALVLAFSAGTLSTNYLRPGPVTLAPLYRTATTPEPTPVTGEPRVRVVFDGATTVDELARIVRTAGLTVVAGPGDAGVYTLSVASTAGAGSMDQAVARLRDDPRVRFAEPVTVSPPSP